MLHLELNLMEDYFFKFQFFLCFTVNNYLINIAKNVNL